MFGVNTDNCIFKTDQCQVSDCLLPSPLPDRLPLVIVCRPRRSLGTRPNQDTSLLAICHRNKIVCNV